MLGCGGHSTHDCSPEKGDRFQRAKAQGGTLGKREETRQEAKGGVEKKSWREE